MAGVVIDTSTVVKWYIPEQHHEQARALRDDFLKDRHDMCAPALMPFEAVNAFNYNGHYDGERPREAATSLDNYGIELVSFGSVGPIAEISSTVDITAYDAAYVGLAVERDATAYTADGAYKNQTGVSIKVTLLTSRHINRTIPFPGIYRGCIQQTEGDRKQS